MRYALVLALACLAVAILGSWPCTRPPVDATPKVAGASEGSSGSITAQEVILFYSDYEGKGDRAYLMKADGTDIRRFTAQESYQFFPSWSRSGDKVALSLGGCCIPFSIATANPDGSALTTIAAFPFPQSNYGPVWSPDGTKIAFLATRPDDMGTDLWVVDASGGEPLLLYRNGNNWDAPTWSPDGNRLAFNLSNGGIAVINADGTGLAEIVRRSNAFDPAWSPIRNDLLAFVCLSTTYPQSTGVCIYSFSAGHIVHETQVSPVISFGSGVAWSRDGSKIAVAASQSSAPETHLYEIDATSGVRNLIAQAPFYLRIDSDPNMWSSNGRMIAVEGFPTSGASHIYVADASSGVLVDVTPNTSGHRWPRFRPSPISLRKLGPAQVGTEVGTILDHRLSMVNWTPRLASGLVVADMLPSELSFVGASWSRTDPPGVGGCSLSGRSLTCAIGDLASGGSVEVSLSTKLRYIPSSRAVTNMACWTATSPAPPSGGLNCDTAVTGVGGPVGAPDLLIRKTGPPTLPAVGGSMAHWDMQVFNLGPGLAEDVSVVDQVPAGFGSITATWTNVAAGTNGACFVIGQVVDCDIGDLPVTGEATVSLDATLIDPALSKYVSSVWNWAWVYPADGNPQNSVAAWQTRFTGVHRNVIFIQGINSSSDCEGSFRHRVQWIINYLAGIDPAGAWIGQRHLPLTVWSELNPGNFRFFSYSGDYSCPGGMAKYMESATCGGIQQAADQLNAYLDSLLAADPQVTFDLLAHSMGGLVAAYWLAQHEGEELTSRVNSVVTFDSPLRGLPMQNVEMLVTLLVLPGPVENCKVWHQSSSNMVWDARLGVYSPIVERARDAVAWFYTFDATRNELRLMEAVPGDRTRLTDGGRHVPADRNHSGIYGWPDASDAAGDRTRILRCIGRAVVGERRSCTPLYEQFELAAGNSQSFPFLVSPDDIVLTVDTLWTSGEVATTLTPPGGSTIDASTVEPGIRVTSDPGYLTIEVDHPEPGEWLLETTASVGPASVQLSADTIQPPAPDEDGDGAPDGDDNCQSTSNASQSDVDGDTIGDACDPDIDGDGVANEIDNCPSAANTDQADIDGDGLGEPCDGDNDNDRMPDVLEAAASCLDPSVDDAQFDFDADGLLNIDEVWIGTDPCLPDTDSDGCTDGRELGPDETLGGLRNPNNYYDFYDITDLTLIIGQKDGRITGFDLSLLVSYGGTSDNGPPNAAGRDYDDDANGNSIDDGAEIDYASSADPAAGPDGAITGFDLSAMVNQGGDSCRPPPNEMAVDADASSPGAIDDTRTVQIADEFEVSLNVTATETPYSWYQFLLEWNPGVLGFVSFEQLEPDPLMDCFGGPSVGSQDYFSTCFKLGLPSTFEGQMERLTLVCLAPGVSPLHLVTVSESPVEGTATLDYFGEVIPTETSDAAVTCVWP